MIIFVVNALFPDKTGMSLRIEREIDELAKIDDVLIICRRKKNQNKIDIYKTSTKKNVKVIRFDLRQYISKPRNYFPFLSEFIQAIRTVYVFVGLLIKVFKENKNSTLYVTASPISVPFICYFIARFFKIKARILEFHDVEPELACDIKRITMKHPLVKLSIILERFLCNRFEKIIVTSKTQASIIHNRALIPNKKIYVIPNSVEAKNYRFVNKNDFRKKYNIKNNDFVVMYIGTISNFSYIIDGISFLIDLCSKFLKKTENLKFIIVGGGEGINYLKECSIKKGCEKQVIFTGKVKKISYALNSSNVMIIPWQETPLTKTILPTKLFEYMLSGKPIIAPNYGEFSNVLKNNKTAILYNPKNLERLIKKIIKLKNNPKLCKKIGDTAKKEYMKNFNWSVVSKNYRKIFI